MFTERHYKEIAKVLKRIEMCKGDYYRECIRSGYHSDQVHLFIILFEKDNKKFSRKRFLKAIYNIGEVEEI